jgi:hemerythrin-like domain-containing protein
VTEIFGSRPVLPAEEATPALRSPLVTSAAIEALRSEHDLHRRMLVLLERMARSVENGEPFPAADMAEVLGFFREFVETFHHAKEDHALYPLALSYGDEADVELVGRLVADHQDTRELLQSLTLFWEPGDLRDEERSGFATLACAYARRMRRHMEIEEVALFPRAERLAQHEIEAAIAEATRGLPARRDLVAWRGVAAMLEERWAD